MNILTHHPAASSTPHREPPPKGKAFFDWWRARVRNLGRFGVLQAPAQAAPSSSWFHKERYQIHGWEILVHHIDDTIYVIRIK